MHLHARRAVGQSEVSRVQARQGSLLDQILREVFLQVFIEPSGIGMLKFCRASLSFLQAGDLA